MDRRTGIERRRQQIKVEYERRKGNERRSGIERRAHYVMVEMNKRYSL